MIGLNKKGGILKMIRILNNVKQFFEKLEKDNTGASIVEVILILVILIGIVLVFKTQITSIVNDAFKSITNNSNSIIN
jgi:Flp pilus assembly pilin Flp